MNPLKLRHFFIENIKCKFPKFPTKNVAVKVREQLKANVGLFLSETDKNNFAIKLKLSFSAIKKGTKQTHFLFDATIVGIFKRLDEKKPIKSLAKTIAKDMLYEKIYTHFSEILNHAPVTKIQLPTNLNKK